MIKKVSLTICVALLEPPWATPKRIWRGCANERFFRPPFLFGLDPLWVSATVLVLAYALIVSGWINHAIVALIGGSIVTVISALDQSEAIAGIDCNTIRLLTGMMILVSISRRSGMFQSLVIWSAQKTDANPAGILLVLQLIAAALSALLNNVSTVLLLAPVTLAIRRGAGRVRCRWSKLSASLMIFCGSVTQYLPASSRCCAPLLRPLRESRAATDR